MTVQNNARQRPLVCLEFYRNISCELPVYFFLQNHPTAVVCLLLERLGSSKKDHSTTIFLVSKVCFRAELVFVRNGLKFKLKSVSMKKRMHQIAVNVCVANTNVMIHAIYRPPGYEENQFLFL